MIDSFSYFEDLTPAQIPEYLVDFLRLLGGPARIWVSGQNPQRTRAVVTLLHGNEPSGIKALHQFLRQGIKPHTNLLILVGSVQAALLEPHFRNRSYPGARDLNRCFNPPYNDAPGRIAQQMLQMIDAVNAETVIDIHNTSGQSPSFGVVTAAHRQHEALISLFTDKLVITELRLGSLMEQSTARRPVVTVECGGAQQSASDTLALGGLMKYALDQQIPPHSEEFDFDLYHHPVRLELEEGLRLAFADQPVLGVELTLLADLDRYNFGVAPAGTLLGWLGSAAAIRRLKVVDPAGVNHFDRYFEICGNRLQTVTDLKLFMITTRPDIALSDCLLYASFEMEHEKVHIQI